MRGARRPTTSTRRQGSPCGRRYEFLLFAAFRVTFARMSPRNSGEARGAQWKLRGSSGREKEVRGNSWEENGVRVWCNNVRILRLGRPFCNRKQLRRTYIRNTKSGGTQGRQTKLRGNSRNTNSGETQGKRSPTPGGSGAVGVDPLTSVFLLCLRSSSPAVP